MGLIINNARITDKESFISCCPFGALELVNGEVQVGAGCKMCKLCVKKSKNGEIEFVEEKKTVDKSLWHGICVYAEHEAGELHPVTLELIGKARELGEKAQQPVYCLLMGSGVDTTAQELLHYGVDKVFVYDAPRLRDFEIEPYTAVFEDFVNKNRPAVILVGATPLGRQLAPRAAARFRTGLTADCTVLDIMENTDLVQIRPAFGGNIMAQIVTPNHRPQMATVRYKVMNAPERMELPSGETVECSVPPEALVSSVRVLDTTPKQRVKSIENAPVLIVAGRGLKSCDDLALLEELAELLGGELACTRPLVETGWMDGRHQIGLSGRTVRPKLIITCGVSGAVQFAAGMKSSEKIIAINRDENAPICNVAHVALIGDLYEIIPKLIEKLRGNGEVSGNVL